MKILAVRGLNLASLEEFEVDLENGVLSDAGLFAISGPTGAGKSTLLDALCLALYDETPRLADARDVVIQEGEAHGADPRSVLRRGAGEGRAEVDFEGKGGRYRAVWAVRRAKKKAEGRFQAQEMALFQLTASGPPVERSGATRTETLRAIEEVVGLSFAEFRRTMLLAQGDFAAFLSARPDERATLLEKMTGTQIYAELSRRAFARHRDEVAQLERLEARLEGLRVAAPEHRAAMDAAYLELVARREDAELAVTRTRAVLERAETLARLSADLREAEARVVEARAAVIEAAPRAQALERRRQASALAPEHRALHEAERIFAEASAAEAAAEAAALEADSSAEGAARALAAATRARAAVAADAERLRPIIEHAKALDVRLGGALEEEDEARRRREDATRGLATAEAKARATRDAEERSRAKVAELVAWLGAHAPDRVVAAQWSRWSAELDRYVEARGELLGLRAAVERATREASTANTLVEARREERAARAAELEVARTAREAAEEAVLEHRSAFPPEQRRVSTLRLTEERSRLEGLRAVVKDVTRLKKRRAEEQARADAAAADARAKRAEARAAGERKKELAAKLAAVAEELEVAATTEELAARRPELLRAGEPCPLCGAIDHPAASTVAERHPRLAVLRGQRTRLENQREEAARAEKEAEVAGSASAQAAKEAEESLLATDEALATRLASYSATLEALALLWSEVRVPDPKELLKLRLLLPAEIDAKGSAGGVDDAGRLLSSLITALQREDARAAELGAAVEARRAEEDRAESAKERADAAWSEAEAERRAAEQRRSELLIRAEAATARAADAAATLEAAFARRPEWNAMLVDDPLSLRKIAAAAVATYEENVAAEQDERARLAAAERDLATASEEVRAQQARLREAEAAEIERRGRREALAKERAALLGGKSAAAQEAELAEARSLAEAAVAAAEERRGGAERDRAARAERAEACAEARAAALAQRDRAAAALERAMAGAGFTSREALEGWLDPDPTGLAAEEAALATLGQAAARAETTAADRRARLVAFAGEPDPPLVDVTGARQVVAAAEDRADALLKELGRLEAERRHDDEARAALAELQPELLAQRRRVDQWAEMSSVIGSADGKKLRTFAQGLSLEALVAEANRQLAQLRPRYELFRVAGADMELAVLDHDLGDEPRGLASLSGGETFLVSLALALALSSLSARDVPLGTLFIDEGFGALDRDALEIALGTLDQLQAAGRKVGIISHLPDIAERIGYVVEVTPDLTREEPRDLPPTLNAVALSEGLGQTARHDRGGAAEP